MASPLSPRPRSPRNDASVPGGVQRQPKRRGVALSCAECRRLKLKYASIPPKSCSSNLARALQMQSRVSVQKGCGAICPEGSLTTGKGNRFVLANTEALHDKINVLATRVRTLEDALLAAHSLNSNAPHHLLTDELLQLKRPLERERQDAPGTELEEKVEVEDNIDSFGSLSFSDNGRSTFFGTTANSWYLLQNEEGSDSDGANGDDDGMLPAHDFPLEPADPAWLAHAFPFSPPVGRVGENMRAAIINKLPRAVGARNLADIYFKHAAWIFWRGLGWYTPISEDDFFDTIFSPVYEQSPDPEAPQGSAHQLAVLCLVLAIGTLVDLEKHAHAPEAMQYYHYARASISIESVLEEQTVTGIQALLLMCHFMFLSDISSPRWAIMGVIVKMAQSVSVCLLLLLLLLFLPLPVSFYSLPITIIHLPPAWCHLPSITLEWHPAPTPSHRHTPGAHKHTPDMSILRLNIPSH
ncbi:hypothetical protein D9619_013449 [Psilocybe cf. subviscida]|uniref:Xylanolytic transcriptional activator regulatory domain-containing protein n=1 Tax=Psilocybe cf. subviscida TaxID=2480587 RepID=A0A8H5BRE7_9AGAR|nr:hypothetical protein D9619_013449 [Psilocybe cf. subviscida]